LTRAGVPFELRQADICELPFASDSFDAVYSGHVLYHIPQPAAQQAALGEMLRVVRPNGVVLLVVANPRPLLFPLRLAKRLIADTPVVSNIARAIRPAPVLPYKPMSIGWMKRQFRGRARVEVISYGIPSVWCNQHVSEKTPIGQALWRTMIGLEKRFPHLSAHLGNFVAIIRLTTMITHVRGS
jgi:SAM-dependent methyltransferase